MAGFFKKIFSFGKKEVVEERVDETAPLPPIKWDALEALKPEAGQAESAEETLAREQEPVAEATPASEPAVEPAPALPPEAPKPEPVPT
ncbi:signal recognition particle-docking protein FtsY, partial [Mesorhizobium sp. B2-7-1]